MEIGSAYPLGATQEIAVRGGNLAEGMPRQFCVNSGEIPDCLQESLGADQLERATRGPGITPPSPARTARRDTSPAWLIPTNWDRLHRGMQRTDVIALLGRPNAARADAHGKTRPLYALEIGPSAVLAGHVLLDDSGVVEVNKPVLR